MTTSALHRELRPATVVCQKPWEPAHLRQPLPHSPWGQGERHVGPRRMRQGAAVSRAVRMVDSEPRVLNRYRVLRSGRGRPSTRGTCFPPDTDMQEVRFL